MARRARGSVIVWTVLMLVVLLSFMALTLNAGRFNAVKGELQNGVDAAALAGAVQLQGTVAEITPDGASSTSNAVRDFASYHFTDKAGASQMAADRILLGEWRAAGRPGCEGADLPTAFQDSVGAHFCEVRARDAAAAFRINAVYARAQRAQGAPGGGPVPVFLNRILGRTTPATADLTAEAIAVTGGPCQSSCLTVPMVMGVGCLTGTGGSACAPDAPPDSAGPMYTLGLSPTPVRSAGWSVFSDTSPSDNAICDFFKGSSSGCNSLELGSYVQVDVGQGNKFNGGCKGSGAEKKVCDWFKAHVGGTIEVPVISMSGNLNEACPSNYTGNAWVVGYSTLQVLAVNCGKTECVGSPWCDDASAPCSKFASDKCVLTRLVCNHQSGSSSTGCAWTGTSSFHPRLVQTRGAR